MGALSDCDMGELSKLAARWRREMSEAKPKHDNSNLTIIHNSCTDPTSFFRNTLCWEKGGRERGVTKFKL